MIFTSLTPYGTTDWLCGKEIGKVLDVASLEPAGFVGVATGLSGLIIDWSAVQVCEGPPYPKPPMKTDLPRLYPDNGGCSFSLTQLAPPQFFRLFVIQRLKARGFEIGYRTVTTLMAVTRKYSS